MQEVRKNRDFRPIYRFISEMIQLIYSYNSKLAVSRILSHGAIFNYLKEPLTQISRQRHHLTMNISQTVRDHTLAR